MSTQFSRSDALREAKNLLTETNKGVLSTHSHTMKGYPFGSSVQFFHRNDCEVILFISDLAQHSKNLAHDPKASLIVFDEKPPSNASHARLTLIGDAQKLSRADSEQEIKDYVSHFPDAEQYQALGDFHIWKINILRARFISGFGKIFWLEKEEWAN